VSAPESPKGGRPRGLPKTGGRQRGTPNRATLSLREKFTGLDYDPIGELIEIARAPNTPLEMRVHIHLGMLPYLYPKRKPVDQVSEEPMATKVVTILEGASEVTNAGADALPET
jgi:hypothetical protein